jgi:hypothetical protein
MKTRFSPAFVQRVDQSMSQVGELQFDLEAIKMKVSHVAMKNELDVLE